MELPEAIPLHRPALLTFACRLLDDPEEAEDAVQAGFERALIALASGIRPLNLRAWLYKIVLREAQRIQEKRKVRRRIDPSVVPSLRPRQGDELTEEEKASVARMVLNEVHHLPRPYREIVLLRFLQHLSYEEVAEALEMPIGTVKSYQARALDQLKQRLGPILDPEDTTWTA